MPILTALEKGSAFLQIQPAHLQKLHGERLNGEQRSAERAAFIRARLHTN